MAKTQQESKQTGHPTGSTDHAGPHLFQEIVRTHQVLIGAFSLEVGMSAARMLVSGSSRTLKTARWAW